MADTRPQSAPAGGKLASSFTWRIRKPIHAAMGMMMIAGLLVAFAPFHLATQRMRAFCGELTPGISLAGVQAKAAASGYAMTPLVDGHARVADPPSYGRRTCELSFDARGLVEAK